MDEFITVTQLLRDCVKNNYNNLKNIYFKKMKLDNILDNDDDLIDEDYDFYLEDNLNKITFEEDVFFKLMQKIKYSKYKNMIYLIFLNDVYISLKTKHISGFNIPLDEIQILNTIENNKVNILLKKIDVNENFLLDILTLYIEYELDSTLETKLKNLKILELSNNLKTLDKFNIYILDNLQYQYKKTRKTF